MMMFGILGGYDFFTVAYERASSEGEQERERGREKLDNH